MRKLQLKIVKIAGDLEKVTSKDLMEYSVLINRIQIKNRICFISCLPPLV